MDEVSRIQPFDFAYGATLFDDLTTLQHPELKQVATNFRNNIQLLGSLPTIFTYFSFLIRDKEIGILQYLKEERVLPFNDALRQVRMHSLEFAGSSSRRDISRNYLEDMLNHNPELLGTLKSLYMSVIVLCWSAFESVVADTWEVALSSKSKIFTQYGFRADELIKGRKKPDFTKFEGMKEAYKVFDTGTSLDVVWKQPILRRLHLDRNLIAHRAGIIDQQYLDRMRDYKILCTSALGDILPIDVKQIGEYINFTIASGKLVLFFADTWMRTTLK